MKRFLAYIIVFVLIINNIPFVVYGGWSGGTTNIAKVVPGSDGLQYLVFKVSSTSSNAKYKYKTIGWDITFIPDGESPRTARLAYNFSDHGGSDDVKIKLEDIFDKISESENKKDRLKRKNGKLIADAIQVILINNVPMGTNGRPINNWNGDFKSLVEGNGQGVKLFTDEASNIISGLPNGLNWSTNTQNDLKNYYNQEAPYDKLYSEITVELDLEVMSNIDDHTIDMSKGEGSAQVRIHALSNIKEFKTNDPKMEAYLNNPSNIRQMIFEISDGTTDKKQIVTSFSSLSGSTDFVFNYLPNGIEDGDSDMNDSVSKDYICTVYVHYYRQCHGLATEQTSSELTKKAPVPDGDPLAILKSPNEVLVGEEITADGSESLAPEGAKIVHYSWKVENKKLTDKDGEKSIKLTYDEPKTITIALTVEDSNGKTDTAMKDVVVKKKTSPPVNWSPSVTLTGPTIVMQGDNLTLRISATDKEDGILKPIISKPSCLVLDSSVKNGENTAKFTESGTYTITASATDSGGKSDSDSIQIEVCPPKPLAIITEYNDYKVGQTVSLDGLNSKAVSKTYPIDWESPKTGWNIKPLGELKEEDIHWEKVKGNKEIAFTSKKIGNVEISLTVANTLGYTHTRTIQRTIVADTPPIADFTLIKKVYRDKDNDKKAIVKAFDKSTSPDNDSITKRVWFYAFDSDNDGRFSDETWYYNNGTTWVDSKTSYSNLFTFADTVDTGNLTDVTVETKHVGKYKFELKVYEEHDNRLLEFIDTSYILTDDTADKPGEECITEVDNIAPITAVKVDVSNNDVYDIVVATDYKDIDLIQLETQLNLLKAEAFANNKEFKIHYVTDQVKIGQQHKVKNYYRYARMIYLRYYLGSGNYQSSTSGGNQNINYNHDLRTADIEYETTQGYTTPIKPFEKGDKVDWNRTSFSSSYHNEDNGTGYDKSGVEFQFYNPDNKIATLTTHRKTTNGSEQGMGFCQIWNSITVVDESVNITNHWSRRSNPQKHDFYYDVTGLDFTKIKDIPYADNSKKVFLYFTKGNNFNYENEDGYNYSATSLTKEFTDYLIYNDYETYVISSSEDILDIKFDSNNHSTDISTQYATLRELARSSSIRGKYIIGDVNTPLWKEQLMHITKKNVIMPNEVTVENNVLRLKFDKEFKEGEELDLTLLQQQLKISDLVGNKIEIPEIKYKVTVEDRGIKELSSLCFSNPLVEQYQKEDIKIIEVTNSIIIYMENNQKKIQVIDEVNAKRYYGENVIELNSFDYTNVKDIKAISSGTIMLLYNNGTVKIFGNKPYRSKWENVSQIASTNSLFVGITHNNKILTYGRANNNYQDEEQDYSESKYNFYDVIETANRVIIMYRDDKGIIKYTSYGNYGYVPFYPSKIQEKYSSNFKVIGNRTTDEIYIKMYGKYYKCIRDYDKAIEPINEINNMNIKKLIPIGSSYFMVIKQDDTIYFSENYKSSLQNDYHYNNTYNQLSNIGEYKNISFVGNGGWVQGTNSEFNTGGGTSTLNSRYIKIDDIASLIPYSYGNTEQMIIIMKNGKRYNLINSINAYSVPSNATYFWADNYGISYMLNNGYYHSTVVPQYAKPGYTYYSHRRFSGKYKKVINIGENAFICLKENGTVNLYRKEGDNWSYLDYYLRNQSNIKDIILSSAIMIIKDDNTIIPVYKGNFNEYLGHYHDFKNKKIKKYCSGQQEGYSYNRLFGLDTQGNVWCTDPNELKLIETNVQDMFNLNGYMIYLMKDGTLSKYGEGKKFETYENMLVTPKFITLKLKGQEEKVYISPEGIQIGYIGKFSNSVYSLQPLKSTQFHIGKHLDGGVVFKYKIFDNKDSVQEILQNEEIDDSWTEVQDLDIISVPNGVYIGVVEVNDKNRAIRYSYMKSVAENL
ncbi:PKD domain-containing protein [Vallitalea sp.]|jgi:hypothetical protein|uniref:PKD domain-containing protein n=1 Tax=Vallitalea sp. TaxID=1882829 RepID=UPI0025DF314D|nr:hypothetical protein [Vallitalea sp.]MCT4686166.1 hypothetical protein [Vallitalea sp.]